MRNTILILLISLIAVSCGKDKFTSAPQIAYKSLSFDRISSGAIIGRDPFPEITLSVTDSEGDLGFNNGKDTSYIYIKNLLINQLDSFVMPDLESISTKNFQADIRINVADVLRGSGRPRPKVDTLFYEIYVNDFAKNKSNVITTSDPIYFVFP